MKIGNFTVIEELGRSPVVIVYKVKDATGHLYTLKILRTIATENDQRRIKRELSTTTRNAHQRQLEMPIPFL